MAYDFQRQQFSLAPPHSSNENVPAQVRAVASILWAHRTKLSASLARTRIEQNALNLHDLLPDREKSKLEAWKENPCYARITSPDRRDVVLSRLAEYDLTHVQELSGKELKSFCLLGANKDILALSPDCREFLYSNSNPMVTSGQLIVQVFNVVSPMLCIILACYVVGLSQLLVCRVCWQDGGCQQWRHYHYKFVVRFVTAICILKNEQGMWTSFEFHTQV